ncbi:MAG: protein kinase [Nannocystis sp.]|nr:protein kinase [Nannocystis sp.]
MEPGLEVQQLKAAVRARLFGTAEAPPTLGGYRIGRLIGRGGMGAVYEAQDERGEVVALKALRGCEPTALARFKHEFRALSDLVHPNLALLHSLVVADDQAFLTMERIDGVDFLAHVRAAPTGQRVARLRGALAQLVDGLAALHGAGKLHRDVKPPNVLVTGEGRVVILDFGLVQELVGPAPEPGDPVAGTPAYMAPELLTGGAPSAASDWYSVGVMLYEALTGELPFIGDSFEVLSDKCAKDPESPLLREPAADPALARLCLRLLAREPGDRPGRAAIAAALVEVGKIGAAPIEPVRWAGSGSQRTAMIGRNHELAVLRRALASVQAGQPGVALVRGGSGVGKTALVQAFLGELGPNTLVLGGRCYEREQVPHNAFDGLFEALTRHLLGLPAARRQEVPAAELLALSRLFPALRRLPEVVAAASARTGVVADEQRGRERAYAAFKWLIGWLVGQGTVVLVIDDLHWADADSAALLAELVAVPAPACLLLASYRVTGIGAAPVVQGLAQRLRGGARVWELALEPLTQDESEALAHALLGPGAAAASAGGIARESAGLPLFVHELVHDVLECISSGSAAGPARLEDLIAARVARLPEPARALLELLTVAARPLAGDVVIGLLDRPAAVRAALHQLSVGRFVRTSRSVRGELIELYHDRIREPVLAGLDAARHRACHARLAQTLLALPAEARGAAEVLAQHLHAAGDAEGARAYMAVAVRVANETLAFARAAELSLAAIGLLPAGDHDGSRALRIDAAQALLYAGSHADGAARFLEAAEDAPPIEALGLRKRAAEALLQCGALASGQGLLQEVLRSLGRPLPRTRLLRAVRIAEQTLWLRRRGLEFVPRAADTLPVETLLYLDTLRAARLAVVNVDPLTARQYQLEHLCQCLEVGEPMRIVEAVAGHAAYLSHRGGSDALAAERLIDHARMIGQRHGVKLEMYLATCAGLVAFNCGAWRTALAHFDQVSLPGSAEPRVAAAPMLLSLCGMWALSCQFYLGEFELMAERRARDRQVLLGSGDAASEARLAVSMQVFTALAADDPGRAAQELAAALQRWPRAGFVIERGHAFLAARVIDLYIGNGARAWARVEEAWPAYIRSYPYEGQHGRTFGEFWRGAAALLAAGEDPGDEGERLRKIVEAAARRILGERVGWAEPLGQLLTAGVAVQRGRSGPAFTALMLAATGLEAAQMPLWAAAARYQGSRMTGDLAGCAAEEQRLRARGVVMPARMVATLVPGFAPP